MVSVNTDTAFPKSARLLRAADYQRVFGASKPVRVSIPEVLVLASPNDRDHPRLGLVVAKKHLRFAVQRNRFKRVTRNCFRQRQRELPGIDIIVLVRRGAAKLDLKALHPVIDQLFLQLSQKVAN